MKPKICVIYHYFELNQNYKDNLLHFLTFGTIDVEKVFCVISGDYSVTLPEIPNVEYFFTDNKNYDYGGHSLIIEKHLSHLDFEYFFFINSSVRGPYLPSYFNGKWFDIFISQFDKDTGIVGTSINILSSQSRFFSLYQKKYGGIGPYTHVQSMVFALRRESLELLQEKKFFRMDKDLDRNGAICDYEINLSQELIRNNYNIKCLLPEYNTIDYRKPHFDPNPASHNGDCCHHDGYFGRAPHPFEVIFIKSNRKLYPEYYLKLLSLTMLSSFADKNAIYLDLNIEKVMLEKFKFETSQNFKTLIKMIKYNVKKNLNLR